MSATPGVDTSAHGTPGLAYANSRPPAICAKPSGKVLKTHSVGSIFDHNLGVFIVTKIAIENTNAAPPAHPVTRTKAAYLGWQRCRAPSAPLTCLARSAAWQSLCTGHFGPQWKTKRINTTD